MPSIEIHPLHSPRNLHQADGRGDSAESSISCETDYQNDSETILVVSDLGSTTVSMELSGSVGGVWLVESKGR